MIKVVKKYLIPHAGNDHAPHILRTQGFVGLLFVIVTLFSLALTQVLVFSNLSNVAAVLSPVLVDLTNADRQAQHLSSLKISPLLTKAAQLKANDMSTNEYFAHNSPQGITPWHWFSEVGYKFTYAGENLAVNFSESQDVESAWMNSPGHRANILNGVFTEIGIATQAGMYEGKPTIYVVQLFGRPVPTPKAILTKTAAVAEAKEVPEDVKVLAVNNNFIAVQTVSSTTVPVAPDVTNIGGTTETTKYASVLERTLSQPRNILMYAYGLIGVLILSVMSLILASEYKRHHFLHISYGLGLLIVMGSLMVGLSSLIPHVVII